MKSEILVILVAMGSSCGYSFEPIPNGDLPPFLGYLTIGNEDRTNLQMVVRCEHYRLADAVYRLTAPGNEHLIDEIEAIADRLVGRKVDIDPVEIHFDDSGVTDSIPVKI